MKLSAFASSFLYDPGKPRFRDYPTFLDGDDTTLPGLEASLDQIGEYQRRLWANRRQALLLVVVAHRGQALIAGALACFGIFLKII